MSNILQFPTPRHTSSDAQPRPKTAVVLNGNARQVTAQLVESFDQVAGAGELFLSRSLDEAQRIAHDIVNAGFPVVLTGGGDGTFVQMVTSITKEARSAGKEPPVFGLLKLGTGNSLAWALGAGTTGDGVFANLPRLRDGSAHRGDGSSDWIPEISNE